MQKLNPKVKIIVVKENDDNYLRRGDEIDRAFMQLRCYSLIIMFFIGVINKTIGIKNVEVFFISSKNFVQKIISLFFTVICITLNGSWICSLPGSVLSSKIC